MACRNCGRGLHEECLSDCADCHPEMEQSAQSSSTLNPSIITGDVPKEKKPLGRPIKKASDILDDKSTGRKRAAQLYPLYEDKPCEWRGKDNCGGGLYPIAGCTNGFQEARHHGPIKNTLENNPNNIHRICTLDHNRWHAANDKHYDEELYAKLPHSPIEREIDVEASS